MAVRFFCFWVFFLVVFASLNAEIVSENPSPSPPPPSPPPPEKQRQDFSPFKPSIAVVAGVLTTMFSITFLLLIYAKHCKRGAGVGGYSGSSSGVPISSSVRKNSGIDRTVIESLPIFRFGSLMGHKDGLDCAVCLARFEPSEVLRLLPKCKHAFHVECVDTWLDAHSTCPLCRYRVDPEDILLIDPPPPLPPPPLEVTDSNTELRRVSGRHSSAGERRSEILQIAAQKSDLHDTTSFRRSADSLGIKKKAEIVAVGCFDRQRKDGLLLTNPLVAERKSFERRFDHRIVVSAGSNGGNAMMHQRWSDVQPSDLLYLRSEKIISDSRKFSDTSVINERSVSEITGLSRVGDGGGCGGVGRRVDRRRERQEGMLSRWMAWINLLGNTGRRSDRTNASTANGV